MWLLRPDYRDLLYKTGRPLGRTTTGMDCWMYLSPRVTHYITTMETALGRMLRMLQASFIIQTLSRLERGGTMMLTVSPISTLPRGWRVAAPQMAARVA